MVHFDIDTLYRNPKALAVITFPGNAHDPILALVESDFTTDIVANYNDVDEGQPSAYQGIVNSANTAISGRQRVIRYLQQTFSQWNGHSKPVFTIPITIVKYKESGTNSNILDIVSTLVSAPAGTYDGLMLDAPFGYGLTQGLASLSSVATFFSDGLNNVQDIYKARTINDRSAAETAFNDQFSQLITGTWCLSYSDWFLACGLILQHTNVVVSKECIRGTNEPLYAKLTLTFTTAVLPDAPMIQSWFRSQTLDNGNDVFNRFGNNNPVTTQGTGGIGSA